MKSYRSLTHRWKELRLAGLPQSYMSHHQILHITTGEEGV